MSNELVIPTDIQPESPSNIELVDDQTFKFRPMMGRAWAQNNSYGDPRWLLKLSMKGMRQSDRARLHAIASESQGAYRTIMSSPYQKNSGSFSTTYAPELFTNSDLSTTTGWSSSSKYSLAASNGVLRATVNDGAAGAGLIAYQTLTTTQYAPYAVRAGVRVGRGAWTIGVIYRYLENTGYSSFSDTFGYGMDSAVSLLTSANYGLYDASTTGLLAGDVINIGFLSAARCALVDGGGNLLLRSDEINNAAWTKTRTTTTTDTSQAPDGTSTMDGLIEDSSNNTHFAFQGVTVTAAAQDIMFSVVVAPAGRNFIELQMQEATTTASQYFILTGGGSVGVNGATGANWSNRRAFTTNLGNGRIRCTLIARKTSAATSVTGIISLASADGTDSYLGNGSNGVVTWRMVLTPSSVPTRGTQTTTAAVAAQSQSGSSFYAKGLPASVLGLMVAGDWFELDGQLKRLTADVDTDSTGLGHFQFRPKIYRAVTDNTPVIVTRPLGRFKFGDNLAFDSRYGLYADYMLNLEEVYE